MEQRRLDIDTFHSAAQDRRIEVPQRVLRQADTGGLAESALFALDVTGSGFDLDSYLQCQTRVILVSCAREISRPEAVENRRRAEKASPSAAFAKL